MKLVVFGANGPTGRLATGMAVREGHTVTAVTRRPGEFPLRDANLRVVRADVMDGDAVDEAVAGQQAVMSTLGFPYTKETVTVYSTGTANIIRAMGEHGLRRLVCVSSPGVCEEIPPEETWFARTVLAPLLHRWGRTVYADMLRMEEIVQRTDLDWTIIRPHGLFDGTEVTDYRVSTGRLPGRYTSRSDLADAMLREAVDDRNLGATIEMVTTAGTPSFATMFLREALHIGK